MVRGVEGDDEVNHFFVTVGTSQLTNDKLMNELDASITDSLRAVNEYETSLPNESRLIETLLPELVRRMAIYWQQMDDGPEPVFINNALGAELTTLVFVLCKQALAGRSFKERIKATASESRFFLHHSDTTSGRLAGRVLASFLKEVWGVGDELIHSYQTKGLHQIPRTSRDAQRAMQNFSYQMAQSLRDSCELEDGVVSPHIIMTGGFKSLIPTLDRFSLAYNIPLNYVFEKSDAPIYGMPLNLDEDTRSRIREILTKEYPAANLPPVQIYR